MTASRHAAAAACGLAAAGLALLVPLFGARGEATYSHASQFISELGAVGAAHPLLVAAAGFAPIGALVLAFLGLASGVLPRSRRISAALACLAAVGVAYLASAVFPCDAGCPRSGSSSQAVHNLFGLLEYAGALTGLLLLGTALRRSPSWRRLAAASFVAAGLVAVGFVAMLIPDFAVVRGLSQRLAEAGIFSWIAYAGTSLLCRGQRTAPCRDCR